EHSLQYLYTAVTPGTNFPEFSLVVLLDGEEFVYYDSNIRKMIPKTEWMEKAKDEGLDYCDKIAKEAEGSQEDLKKSLAIVMQCYNHTKGIHTLQRMYGCEKYGDETKRGYDLYGYDGEDLFSLHLNTGTWTSANDKAVITKLKWEETHTAANHTKACLLNECPDWLMKYVGYSRSTLERKVPPEVSLFQKDITSQVVCHATGFFPKAVSISWKKTGEDLYEDVDLRETLPNEDGTFQSRSILTVSSEELDEHNYTCVIQHSSLEKEVVLQVSDHKVPPGGVPVGIIGAVVGVILFVVLGCVGVLIWKKKS
ncbi:hypothetical protein NFI96_017225, partial [Prochilodus magdalenae]